MLCFAYSNCKQLSVCLSMCCLSVRFCTNRSHLHQSASDQADYAREVEQFCAHVRHVRDHHHLNDEVSFRLGLRSLTITGSTTRTVSVNLVMIAVKPPSTRPMSNPPPLTVKKLRMPRKTSPARTISDAAKIVTLTTTSATNIKLRSPVVQGDHDCIVQQALSEHQEVQVLVHAELLKDGENSDRIDGADQRRKSQPGSRWCAM